MKARTIIRSDGFNPCKIFFTYEDYYGTRFGSYAELKKDGDGPRYLIGYLYSYYCDGEEPIYEIELRRKPTMKQVKEFITKCKKIILED